MPGTSCFVGPGECRLTMQPCEKTRRSMSTTTLLIADDDRKIIDMLRRTLAYEGYNVIIASDGNEALVKAQNHRPDILILDWLMPGLDGIEVARRIRAVEPTPILMLTSWAKALPARSAAAAASSILRKRMSSSFCKTCPPGQTPR